MMLKKSNWSNIYLNNWTVGGFALICALVSTFLVTYNLIYGLAFIALFLLGVVIVLGVKWLRIFIFFLLIAKPVIDLTWRWSITNILGQRINLQTVIALMLLAITAVAILLYGRRLFQWPIIYLMVFSTFVSVLYSPSSEGINDLIRLYAGLACFFTAGVLFREQKVFDRFSGFFLLAIAVPVVLSFMQKAEILPYDYFDWWRGYTGVIGRASGTYQHPLVFVYFLMYSIPVALYVLSLPNISIYRRYMIWLFIGCALIALFFTYHRVGLIAVCAQIWLWFVLTKRYQTAIVLLSLAILLVIWRWNELKILYVNIFDILLGRVDMFSWQFLRGRGAIWFLYVKSYVEGGPLVWMIGYGNAVAEDIIPGTGYLWANEPHNDFVRFLYTYGLLGLGTYVTILMNFLWSSLLLRRSSEFYPRQLGNVMLLVLLGVFLMSLTTEPMRYPSPVWYLFAFGAIVLVQRRLQQSKLNEINLSKV